MSFYKGFTWNVFLVEDLNTIKGFLRISKQIFLINTFLTFCLICKAHEWHSLRPFVSPGRIQLWGHAIAVDWAEPEVEVDEDTMSTVKILYIRNLMLATTEEAIEKEFSAIKPGN